MDLTRIDGVDGFTALKVISESRHRHDQMGQRQALRLLAGAESQTTASPAAGSSAQRPKPSANRAAAALRLAANALHRSDSALGAFLRRKKAQLGAPKAITATAHKLAQASSIPCCATATSTRMPARNTTRDSISSGRCVRHKRRAAQLGYQLVPVSDGEHQDTGLPFKPAAAAL